VSGIRNEVVAVRWGAIRVSVTECPFWRIVSWIPRYEGTAASMSAVKAASDAVERVVESVAVEADAATEWVEMGDENCGEFHSDAPKSGPRPLSNSAWIGPIDTGPRAIAAVRMRIVGYAASYLTVRCWRREV
jgi:hypothetical protein